MSFQVYQNTIFLEMNSRNGVQPDPKHAHANQNATLLTKRTTVLFWHNELFRKFLTGNFGSMLKVSRHGTTHTNAYITEQKQ